MKQATCCVDECERTAIARLMCKLHYERWRRHGDPAYAATTRNMSKFFWSKVDQSNPDDCWPWTGQISDNGYGMFGGSGAHRAAYRFAVGPIDAEVLDHRCHESAECQLGDACPHRRCCNPAHLKPSTQQDNALRGYGPTAINAKQTRCPQGHPYDDVNTYWRPKGGRGCRACMRERCADYRRRKRQ